MLDNNIKQQVRELFSNLISNYKFIVEVSDEHPEKENLITLLSDVANESDKITLQVIKGSSLEFKIAKNNVVSSVVFKAVPTGHEFSTLLLFILNLDGKGKNLLDEALANKVRSIKGNINIKSFISLSCTNCPDVVQSLNLLSIYNPNIINEIIDGAINKDLADSYNVQAVPSVYADGILLSVGRVSLTDLINKLEEKFGCEVAENQQIVEKEFDLVVAGGGPAGVSAAIYSARKGMNVAIIADKVGGQVLETSAIENLISVPNTTGTKLGADLASHLKEYPISILDNRKIDSFNINNGVKILKTNINEIISSKYLVIATGASWRRLNIPGESKYIGQGVAFCTHCDGPFYKNKRVVVIGGGNSGLEAAIDLANIATHVTLLEFLPELKGDKVLQDKLKSFSNVNIVTNAQTLEILGNGTKVTGLIYKDRETNKDIEIQTDGIFIQIGLVANSSVFKDEINVNRVGEIEIDVKCRTAIEGVYAAGDVTTVPYKQIVIAMGEGAKAALSAFEDSLRN